MRLPWIKKDNAEREQMEALELLIATDESAAKGYRLQERMDRVKRRQQRVQQLGGVVVAVTTLVLVSLFAVGMLLAWLHLLPMPYCGEVVHWWTWCRHKRW